MVVFCSAEDARLSVNDVGCSTADYVLNYSFGAIFILIFIGSLILNPMVFLYNHKQKQSLATMLFQFVSLVDFMTNLYHPVAVAVRLFKTEVDTIRNASSLQIAYSIYIAPLAQSSGMATTLLAITRYIQIRSPFCNVRKHLVLAYAIGYIAFLYTSYIYVFTTSDIIIWQPSVQNAWHVVQGMDIWAIAFTIPYNIHCFLAAVTSGLTIKKLWGTDIKSNGSKRLQAQRRGSLTILIMNIGNLLVFLCTLFYMGLKMAKVNSSLFNFLKFFTFAFLPLALSAVNPLILILRSTGFKRTMTAKTMAADSALDTIGFRANTRRQNFKNASMAIK